MKKIILMTIMISTILISCGGSGGSASAVNESREVHRLQMGQEQQELINFHQLI